ncbi:phosphatase PAP2 family protein [Frigidibacter sp. MR17.24]|uniref:phosphatase PAP2 family protein n=1 Tax=Frigidibacter sp. MR17.24 TaxID=3127345 RepID=UPI003012AD8B
MTETRPTDAKARDIARDRAADRIRSQPLWQRLHRSIRNQLSPAVFGFVALISGAVWIFVEVAEEMASGETHAFDEAVLLWMRNTTDRALPAGPAWLETVMRDLTALGGVTVLGMLVASVVGLLWFQSRHRTAIFLLIAVAGGQLFSNVAKAIFDRPRPDLVPHGTLVTSASFPSGHSMMSAVIWLTLAAMVARTEPSRALRVYLMSIAILITVLVGISRVYLGVHWPTDVLGGWAAGLAWAMGCTALAKIIDPLPEPPAPELRSAGEPPAAP